MKCNLKLSRKQGKMLWSATPIGEDGKKMWAIAAIAKRFFDVCEGRKRLCGLHGVVQTPMPLSRLGQSLLSKFARFKSTPKG